MVLENGNHPQAVSALALFIGSVISHNVRTQLKDSVCSPAGTAIQGIRLLERAGFRGIMMDAVHAASKRALELSKLENGEDRDIYVKR